MTDECWNSANQMVISVGQSETGGASSIKRLVAGYVAFCMVAGIFAGYCLNDWMIGLIAVIYLVIFGACLPLICVLWGVICIPPMMLVDKLTGRQAADKQSGKEGSPEPELHDGKEK